MAQADLADLDAFAAVARARSFRGAAAVRGVSPSSLSEAVRRLEGRLGVRLLNRTTRSVTPTEAGTRLLERLGPALGEVAAALDAVNSFRDSPTGTLRLNVPSIVARCVLPPIACAFLARHPGITLEVVAEDGFLDVLAAGFDAGVRYDERLEQDMIAVPIGPRVQRFVCGAAPAYLAARGAPQHPRDLLEHACIRHRFASGMALPWEFERDGEVVRISPKGPLVASAIDLELAAAEGGLGVITSFEEFLAPAFSRGTLVPVLADWWQSFSGPFLYYAGRDHLPAPLRAFVAFLRERARGGATSA
ncbi:LysR family transcriptional regulator [Rhodoplanes sp. TEM]|uniref:LysR family transcriptional regulator n=1 Tax=Rhodoplanes tepidamans TaxID=200616 RepID=A0ABT5J820_RHOTP|nr:MULTISPECIES: LysR family transcriptional regulator [Rhodoplanes]MDC7785800.1 LysR family transcriptional regulator [Rhodoplanes tepidamans]MDC7984067.1 LysR family transcriptional regulator [Rhodoplanes sp. TEM]MDQ0354637.1 DNA-binding transcriptional LysR family regulator [Rhodoplanes tepidamans]